MQVKNRKRSKVAGSIPAKPEVTFVNVKKIVSMTVDAAYFYVLMEDGQLWIGARAQVDAPGIQWSEGEPVPGTFRAAEVAAMRESISRATEEARAAAAAKPT